MKKVISTEMKKLAKNLSAAWAAIATLLSDIIGVLYYPVSNDWNGKPFKAFDNKKGSGFRFAIWVGPKYKIQYSSGNIDSDKIESCFGKKISLGAVHRNGFLVWVSIWDNDMSPFAIAMRKIYESGSFESDGKSVKLKAINGRYGNLGFFIKGMVAELPSPDGKFMKNLRYAQSDYALFAVDKMNDDKLEESIPTVVDYNTFCSVNEKYHEAADAVTAQKDKEKGGSASVAKEVKQMEEEE